MPKAKDGASRGAAVEATEAVREPARMRAQFTIGADTVRRLRVHCSLSGTSESKFVEEALLSCLREHGRGRELFDPTSPKFFNRSDR